MYRLLTCLSVKCPFVISFSQYSKPDSSTKSSATDFIIYFVIQFCGNCVQYLNVVIRLIDTFSVVWFSEPEQRIFKLGHIQNILTLLRIKYYVNVTYETLFSIIKCRIIDEFGLFLAHPFSFISSAGQAYHTILG